MWECCEEHQREPSGAARLALLGLIVIVAVLAGAAGFAVWRLVT